LLSEGIREFGLDSVDIEALYNEYSEVEDALRLTKRIDLLGRANLPPGMVGKIGATFRKVGLSLLGADQGYNIR